MNFRFFSILTNQFFRAFRFVGLYLIVREKREALYRRRLGALHYSNVTALGKLRRRVLAMGRLLVFMSLTMFILGRVNVRLNGDNAIFEEGFVFLVARYLARFLRRPKNVGRLSFTLAIESLVL